MSDYEYDRMVEKKNFRRKFGTSYSESYDEWEENLKEDNVEYLFTTEEGKEYQATADVYATVNCYSNGSHDPQYSDGGGVLDSIGYDNLVICDENGNEIDYKFTEKEEKEFEDFIYEYLDVGNYVS